MKNYSFRTLVNVARDLNDHKFSDVAEITGFDTSTISNVLRNKGHKSEPCEEALAKYTTSALQKFFRAIQGETPSFTVNSALRRHRGEE